MLALLLASILSQASPTTPPPPGMRHVTECVSGERVLTIFNDGTLMPSTISGQAGPGLCSVWIDELLRYGIATAEYHELLRGATVPAPSAEAVRLGVITSHSYQEVETMRRLAMASTADARIFVSRYLLTQFDGGIVARVCEGTSYNPLPCSRATAQYNAALEESRRSIRETTARLAAAPTVTSSGGGYSSSYTPSASTPSVPTPTSTPVRVQSEIEIRRSQDQCRRGSGSC